MGCPARGAAVPAQAKTWGGSGTATTLVLYDTTNSWGYLGQLYGIAAGNLASHFGKVTAEPVANYVAGQVNNYTATIYIGSTYNEPLPLAFLNDVLSTSHPVIWAADNIWQLTGTEGSSADTAFMARYGWDPSQSYFDTTDNPATITYKGQAFTRNSANGANILAPDITSPSAVTVLGTANCTDASGNPAACAPIAQTHGDQLPLGHPQRQPDLRRRGAVLLHLRDRPLHRVLRPAVPGPGADGHAVAPGAGPA